MEGWGVDGGGLWVSLFTMGNGGPSLKCICAVVMIVW